MAVALKGSKMYMYTRSRHWSVRSQPGSSRVNYRHHSHDPARHPQAGNLIHLARVHLHDASQQQRRSPENHGLEPVLVGGVRATSVPFSRQKRVKTENVRIDYSRYTDTITWGTACVCTALYRLYYYCQYCFLGKEGGRGGGVSHV